MPKLPLVFVSFSASAVAVVAHGTDRLRGSTGSVMVVSGISAHEEMCLTAIGGIGDPVSLQPCADAVQAADGSELFTFDGGRLVSEASRLCISRAAALSPGRDRLALASCSTSADVFAVQGNGQLRIGENGSCVSQTGISAGVGDAALHAAASASSVLHVEHGPGMAVDGRSTYWASALDPALPVELSFDLGHSAELQSAVLDWEYPAKSFAVFLSPDGATWEEVYSTNVNTLHTAHVPLGLRQARRVKVVMHEPHPVHARVGGHAVFGVRRLALLENRLRTIAAPCSEVGLAPDARDKYFVVDASARDVANLPVAHAATTGVDIATKSLASVVSALDDVQPELLSCVGGHSAMRQSSVASVELEGGIGRWPAAGGDPLRLLRSARNAVINVRSMLL